ncbi:MAG: DsbC family protein, partial [Moraxellaceae bacterium]
MSVISRPLSGLLLACSLLSGMAAANPEVVQAKLKGVLPDVQITSVRMTPAGLYEVQAKGYETVYVTADGRFLFQGEMLEIQGNRLGDAADSLLMDARRQQLPAIPVTDTVQFPAAGGTPKAIVWVFTDVDCGYCRRLHQEVPAMNRRGIEVRYLAFPRAGETSASADKLASVWCDANRREAMNRAKAGETLKPAPKVCKHPVAAQKALGERP